LIEQESISYAVGHNKLSSLEGDFLIHSFGLIIITQLANHQFLRATACNVLHILAIV